MRADFAPAIEVYRAVIVVRDRLTQSRTMSSDDIKRVTGLAPVTTRLDNRVSHRKQHATLLAVSDRSFLHSS
jgi:hypothetical protein